MADHSKIEWCDATWNCIRGCTKVSPGCKNCYAETFAERFRGVKGHPYEQGFDLQLVPEKLIEPLSWKKPRRVFVNSMSDLFQDGVPDAFIDRVFAVMALAPQHTFQVLTKRPERMRAYLAIDEDTLLERWASATMEQELPLDEIARDAVRSGAERDEQETFSAERHWSDVRNGDFPLKHVWLGVSVENQHFADERIPLLLQTPAAVRFISAEPLLGPIDLCASEQLIGMCEECHDEPRSGSEEDPICDVCQGMRGLDWVIVGGESGPGARPFDLAWARSIVAQCQAASVPVFCKQMGSRPVDGGVPLDLSNRKGGDPNEWPPGDWPREFPHAA